MRRLTSAGGPLGAVAYQYDLAGRQTRITWPNETFYAAYEYDVAGALIAVRENGAASGAGVLALVVYDDLGRRASLTRGNGVVTTYAYDSASRLDVLTHNLSGAGADVTLDFAHNAAGQILSRDRTSANGGYVYPQPGMNVDAYVNNGLNQIASLDGAGFTHDSRGNLTSAGGVSYAYDAFNRLLSAGAVSLTYDPAGRLYETSVSGTPTRFLYDGLQAIAEYNTSGTLLRRYVPGAGLDEHLVMYEGAGASDRRWIVQDDLGSVVSIADSSGAALNVNSYDEYGMPASGNSGLFGYTGQMWLQSAGLYHYRTRVYSPALGRFLQTDPIGGLNLYTYVGNDPINFTDPLGLQRAPHPDGGGTGGDLPSIIQGWQTWSGFWPQDPCPPHLPDDEMCVVGVPGRPQMPSLGMDYAIRRLRRMIEPYVRYVGEMVDNARERTEEAGEAVTEQVQCSSVRIGVAGEAAWIAGPAVEGGLGYDIGRSQVFAYIDGGAAGGDGASVQGVVTFELPGNAPSGSPGRGLRPRGRVRNSGGWGLAGSYGGGVNSLSLGLGAGAGAVATGTVNLGQRDLWDLGADNPRCSG